MISWASIERALAISTSCCWAGERRSTGVSGSASRPTRASRSTDLAPQLAAIDQAPPPDGLSGREDVLRDAQRPEEAALLEDDGDPGPLGVMLVGEGGELATIPFQGPAVGMMDPGQDMHEGALAGPVLSDQGMDLAAADLQVDSVECADARESLADRAGDQQGAGRIRDRGRLARGHRPPHSVSSLARAYGPSASAYPSADRRVGRPGLRPEATGCLGILQGVRRVEPADPHLPPQAVDPDLDIARREIGQQDPHGRCPGEAPARRRPGDEFDRLGRTSPPRNSLTSAKTWNIGKTWPGREGNFSGSGEPASVSITPSQPVVS